MSPLITVPDQGAVDVIRELLADYGIEVQVRRLEVTPYTPSVTGAPLQLRVPAQDLQRATEILASYNEELEREAEAQSGAPAPTPALPSASATEREPRRGRSLVMLVATTLVPLPVGALAIGVRWLATVLLAVFAAGLYLVFTSAASDYAPSRLPEVLLLATSAERHGWSLCFGAKLADVLLTAAMVYKRHRNGANAHTR